MWVYHRWNFYGGLRKTILFLEECSKSCIQGHWFWYESKARMRLPITPSYPGPILHRFRDIVLLTPPLFQPIFEGLSIYLKLISRKIIFEVAVGLFQPMWSRYRIVTDKRTDDMWIMVTLSRSFLMPFVMLFWLTRCCIDAISFSDEDVYITDVA